MDAKNWMNAKEDNLFQKRYSSYQEYLEHQASKLGEIAWLKTYHGDFREALFKRCEGVVGLRAGATALCLGARTGAECEAFTARGALAIGVDLNPGEKNRFVVHGDFHNLQFADAVFDLVYTNALDHAMDLTKLLAEVRRVLKHGGTFFAEIVYGSGDECGREPGAYESLWWDRVDNVIMQICNGGFWVARRRDLEFPWQGTAVEFIRA